MNGKGTKHTAKENSNMLIVISSTVNGKTTRQMDLAPTTIKTVQNTLATGKMMSNMERASRHGQMDRNMTVTITWGKRTAKECMRGMTAPSTPECGMTIKYPDLFS